MSNGNLWLIFQYDEQENDYLPISIRYTLQDVMDYIHKLKFNPPFFTHYRIVQFSIKDTMSIRYDDGKILIS